MSDRLAQLKAKIQKALDEYGRKEPQPTATLYAVDHNGRKYVLETRVVEPENGKTVRRYYYDKGIPTQYTTQLPAWTLGHTFVWEIDNE